MPVQPTYPGVYIQELPSGVRPIVGVATSVTAFVGRTPKGPVNDPTTVFNFGEYERLFGGLDLDSSMSYAVRDFFLNGGGQAVIVRLFAGTPAEEEGAEPDDGLAAVDLPPEGAGTAITLSAANPGEWANGYSIEIEHLADNSMGAQIADRYGYSSADDLFTLRVYADDARTASEDGALVYRDPPLEEIRSVSLVEGRRRLDRVLDDVSDIVRVDTSLTGATGRPAETSAAFTETGVVVTPDTVLADGDNGEPLNSAAYFGSRDDKTGIYALEKLAERGDIFNLLSIPPDVRGDDTPDDVYSTALSYCVERRALLIMDSPSAWGSMNAGEVRTAFATGTLTTFSGTNSRNAAMYFPRVRKADPLRDGQVDIFPNSGIVAGIMARTDVQRGVWKAPAGLEAGLVGISSLDAILTNEENGQLNPLGLNCLRTFPVNGTVIWGARTLRGADTLADDYKYVPVRRVTLFIEESLYRGTQWAVFEPNDETLWSQLRLNIGAFMQRLFRQGAFQGTTRNEAYYVLVDSTTTTQNDINLGIVNIEVGFAPLKPAEFVVISIRQMAGQIGA